MTLALLVSAAETDAAHTAGRNAWWLRAHEFLDHLRIRYSTDAELTGSGVALLVTPGHDVEELERWVRAGGYLVVVSDLTTTLAALAGVVVGSDTSGQVELVDDPLWARRPPRTLHALAGARLAPEPDTVVLARWRDDGSAAMTRRALGAGAVVCFGVDVWQTVTRIVQGDQVERDGIPARDGTAPVDDGILKCEDGLTLSFDDDRRMPPGQPPLPDDFVHGWPATSATPVFDLPQADLWQAAVLQALCWTFGVAGVPLAWLDYWPRAAPAVAHMSHDADLNQDEDAAAALDTFREAEVRVTWCHVSPGGYAGATHDAVTAAGHENALHFNALPDQGGGPWRFETLRDQLAWAQQVTGESRICSNKNHYTRWEGSTEFAEWCERLGIEIDESRGPSKLGTSGFPFGTAHLSFPMAAANSGNRRVDVLSLPLHAQDLGHAAHLSVADVVLDGATEVHGVAHFLFHGPHLRTRPVTRQACLDVAAAVRERGMRWLTARELNDWERARRGVDTTVELVDGRWRVTVTSAAELTDAGIVLLLDAAGLRLHSGAGALHRTTRHGMPAWVLTTDLVAGENVWTVEEPDVSRSPGSP